MVDRAYGVEGKQPARGLEQRSFEDYGGLSKTANLQNPVGAENANRDAYVRKADAYRTANPDDVGVNPKADAAPGGG
jgi:hypothetical protein